MTMGSRRPESGNGSGDGNGRGRPAQALGFRFPCRYEIKAMGRHSIRFEALVHAIVSRHIGREDLLASKRRLSRNHRYLSVTCIIRAQSRDQLERIYADLRQCPEVLAAL
jgi:hypothetical protein